MMPKINKTIFFSFISFFLSLLSSYSYAAPSVSSVLGSFVDGQEISISGSNFGEKASANPLVWDDFEDGVIDTSATSGTWTVVHGSLETTYIHNGSYAVEIASGAAAQVITKSFTGADSLKLYLYRWTRYSATITSNTKFLRIHYSGASYPRWVWSWHSGGLTIIEGTAWSTHYIGSINPPSANTWYLEEWELQMNSGIDQDDGQVRYWRDGIAATSNLPATDVETRSTSNPGLLDQLHWGKNDGEDSVTIWQDDLYFDTTWARVMIGNNSDFNSCTHREIQIPTAWSDNSITITVNQGSFDPCETYYLFVVDADGNVNTAGYPIRIVTGAGEAPCPPIGLEIQQ